MNIVIKRYTLWLIAIFVYLLTSCGDVRKPGIKGIVFKVKPVPVTVAWPSDLSSISPAAFLGMTGTVSVDPIENMGTVSVNDLPDLPDGYTYGVMLGFADSAMGGLNQMGEIHELEETFASAEMGSLEKSADEEEAGHAHGGAEPSIWSLMIMPEDAGVTYLTSLRTADIEINGPNDFAVTIFSGTIDDGGKSTSGGASAAPAGHTHGP